MKWAAGGQNKGYTIVEVMIVLAVSSAMFISAASLISGKQARADFTSGVRDFETSLNDIANDVSDGYFSNTVTDGTNTGPVNCSASASNFSFSVDLTGTRQQGVNQGCIFVGKALQLAPLSIPGYSDSTGVYTTVPLVGFQYKLVGGARSAANGNTDNINDAGVRALYPTTSTSIPKSFDPHSIGHGVTISCALYSVDLTSEPGFCTAGGATPATFVQIDTIAFVTTFNGTSLSGGEDTSNGNAQVDVLVPSELNAAPVHSQDLKDGAEKINNFTIAGKSKHPVNGVYMCLSGGINQHAWVRLGGSGSRFSALGTIMDGGCS